MEDQAPEAGLAGASDVIWLAVVALGRDGLDVLAASANAVEMDVVHGPPSSLRRDGCPDSNSVMSDDDPGARRFMSPSHAP
jgi:hypothetical protein